MAYTWNSGAQRYRDESGRFVRTPTVDRVVRRTIDATRRELDRLADDLREGRLALAQFQVRAAQAIKEGHVAVAVIAWGGRAQVGPELYGRIGAVVVRPQYAYLRRFVAEIADGDRPSEWAAQPADQALRRVHVADLPDRT